MIEQRTLGPVRLYLCALSADATTRREAERAAVARLLEAAFPEGCVLRHTPEGAPVVDGAHISISHSRTHAALAVCADAPVGVDVETARAQLARVAPRVLSADELAAYGGDADGLLRAWTLKEALYKAALTPGVDFRRDIHLPLGHKKNEATVAAPGGVAKCFAVLASEVTQAGGLAVVVQVSP